MPPRTSGGWSMGQSMRCPMRAASSMATEQKWRTSGSARMRSTVAPVRAETGFMVRLPQSLYQMSRRTWLDRVTSMPAACSRPATCVRRTEEPPPGSPRMMPCPMRCHARPGSSTATPMWSTAPSTWRSGMAREMTPPGSTLSRGLSGRPGTPCANHHGTPFMAGRITVEACSSGAIWRAMCASAGPLTARMTRSCGPRVAGSSLAMAGAWRVSPPSRSRQP